MSRDSLEIILSPVTIHSYKFFFNFSEELAKEKIRLEATQEEAKKLRNELQRVLAEGEGYRAAAALADSSQKEELETLQANYQEEIASLRAIMSGKVLYCGLILS